MKSGKLVKIVGRGFALFGVAVMISSVMPAQTKAAENGGMYAGQQESVDSSKDIECTKLVLDSEAVEVLRQDYLQKLKEMYPNEASVQNWTVTDILIEQYCGTYDGNEVVVMSAKGLAGMAVQTKVQIGEHEFVFANSSMANSFYVHKKHEFIPVKDAYEDGLLSDEDIAAIAKVFENAHETEMRFEDVKRTDWFYEAVEALYAGMILTGPNPNTFAPYESIIRAQFAVILYRMEKEPEFETEKTFSDVDADSWCGKGILWAAENGVVTGYENGLYGTVDNITREQMAVMLYRYAKYKGYDVSGTADYSTFKDADDIQVFAKDGLNWAVANGIIKGKDLDGDKVEERLEPQGSASRAEAAVMIQRFVEKYLK